MQEDRKPDVLKRLSYIEGHVAGIRKMVEEDKYCVDILRQTYAVRKALEKLNSNGSAMAAASLTDVNKLMIESERKLTTAEGLPNRPWFKHQIYAPGFYTGYAAKTMPAVREAIEQKQWKQAEAGIVVVAGVLQDEAELISAAAAKLGTAAR